MLHLYQSNRLEHLAELMSAIFSAQISEHPLAQEEIVVQSQGMRRFINHFLAQQNGITANMRFSLPAGLAWRLMRETLNNMPELSPFSPEVMRWRLMNVFASDEFNHHGDMEIIRMALGSYLENGAYAAYQLAGQLADVFDQYLVYRPEWIEAWQQGKLIPNLHQDQFWQAKLWQCLDDGTQTHRVGLWKQLLAQLPSNQCLPKRFSIFGMAALAPMYLELLIRLSEVCDVYIFALNPSEHYWGKAIEPSVILAQSDDVDLTLQGHPLLASLGKQGRDFFDALAETETASSGEVFEAEATSPSLLHTLQHQIQTQTLPTETCQHWLSEHRMWLEKQGTHIHNTIDQICTDSSIQIHSAHSPLRELQILKDRLLLLLEQHPDWQPDDIAVLTPNIEPYIPFIEGIFSNNYRLPYTISDVRLSRRQPLLYAFEQTLAILSGRFEIDTLMPLLDNDAVQRRFGLTHEDLPLLHDTVKRLNIHWGADEDQRREHGGNNNLFTWQQGLERMILGWAMPEHSTLWQNISPWHTNPDHIDTLSRFAALIRLLSDTRTLWKIDATITEWTERVRTLLNALCMPADTDRTAAQQLEQALADWATQTALAEFNHTISIETAIAHIRRFLGSQSDAGFLRGGITFCSMVPMRSLPFKIVCLLGLNDGDFPRNTKAAPFDLIAKHPKKGDRARRDDDRYLFLEAILSAREVLYLSYIGRNIRTNESLAPSVLLHELTDTIAAMYGVPAATLSAVWAIQHPLQNFSTRYFNRSPRLFSSRSDYANALNFPALPPKTFISPKTDETTPPTTIITQNEFIRFWRNPIRSYLKNTLDWQPPFRENIWNATEPFSPEQQPDLDNAYIHARENHIDFEHLATELTAQSLFPPDELGKQTRHDYAAKAARIDNTLLNSLRLPEQNGLLISPSGTLAYQLTNCRQHGQIFTSNHFLYHNSKPSAADQIELLLLHLIYCATAHNDGLNENERFTYYISLHHTIRFPPISKQVAKETLALWISAYQSGQNAPIPFFPRMNLCAAIKFYEKESAEWETTAQTTAANIYHGGYQGFAQADYPEVKLIYGRDPDEPPPYLLPIFRQLTENLFAPLRECLAALSHS